MSFGIGIGYALPFSLSPSAGPSGDGMAWSSGDFMQWSSGDYMIWE